MSELKEHLFCDCNEMFLENGSPLSNDIRPYYRKSEADKVIADLVKKNKRLAHKDIIMASEAIKEVFKELYRCKWITRCARF